MTITLQPASASLADLATIYWNNDRRDSTLIRRRRRKAAARIAEIAAGNAPVYGINTGFGKLASIKIDAADVATLQRNLILSHCCGVGDPLPDNIVRLIMALKLVSLGRGASGVRLELIRLIEGMLERGVIPVIPEKGSVGASGDLAPLAHMAAAMIGEGEAFFAGERMPAAEALRKAGLEPVVLAAKEGLALINGTQVSTALALAGLFRAHRAAQSALVTGALSTDAAMGSSAPFHPEIHTLRGHRGPDRCRQRRCARCWTARKSARAIRGRRTCAGSLLHPLPAAGGRRLPRPSAPWRPHAGDRGQRRDRQSAGAFR